MRLTGLSLVAARRFAETSGGARILRQKVFRDYRIDALLDLPAEARAPLLVHPGPLIQNRRRGWRGKDLQPPTPVGYRSTAAELRRAYESGETSPPEILGEIKRRHDTNAFGEATFSPFCCLDFERASQAAKASADRYQRGEPLGPLDGIPLPVKDQYLMKGLPTTAGCAYLAHNADEDAHFVEVLRDAGALLYAKTHSTEWGMNPCGFSPHASLPRNVYNKDRAAGGSSTGTAVAIALGLAPVGSGSDGGGSIRIPAAMNGIFGIKPTFVRIGRTGDLFGSSSVSTAGPLGTSTADLVDFLSVAATVDDPQDPTRRWAPRQRNLGERWYRALGRGVDGCRIGIPTGEWEQLDDSLRTPSMEALRQLENDGAELIDVEVPLMAHAPAIGVLSIGMETLANLQDECARCGDQLSDELRMTLAMLRTISATEFLTAQRSRAALKEQVRDTLEDVDLLALPTTLTTASDYPIDLDATPLADDDALRAMTRFTFLANITGLPAGTVPVGLHDGLPFGLQFVGAAWDEASVLAAMAHAERQQWTQLPQPPGCRPLSP